MRRSDVQNLIGSCWAVIYVSSLVLDFFGMVITFLGLAVLATYSLQNGCILLGIAFLISPLGLPQLAVWLLGKVQLLKNLIRDFVYG